MLHLWQRSFAHHKQNYIKYFMIRCARVFERVTNAMENTAFRQFMAMIYNVIYTYIIRLSKQPKYFSLAIWAHKCVRVKYANILCQIQLQIDFACSLIICILMVRHHNVYFYPLSFPGSTLIQSRKVLRLRIFPYLGYDCISNTIFSVIYRKCKAVVI